MFGTLDMLLLDISGFSCQKSSCTPFLSGSKWPTPRLPVCVKKLVTTKNHSHTRCKIHDPCHCTSVHIKQIQSIPSIFESISVYIINVTHNTSTEHVFFRLLRHLQFAASVHLMFLEDLDCTLWLWHHPRAKNSKVWEQVTWVAIPRGDQGQLLSSWIVPEACFKPEFFYGLVPCL